MKKRIKKSHSEINLAGGFGMRLDSTSEKSQGAYVYFIIYSVPCKVKGAF